MMRRLILIGLFILFSVGIPQPASTQPPGAGACPVVVERALQQVGDNCGGLARSAACYGYFRVNALFYEAQPEGAFSVPADSTALNLLRYVQAAPLDEATQQWGVAMLHLQANVPNTLPGQAVPFLLLGDTETLNTVAPEDAFLPANPVLDFDTVNSSNLRTLPEINANILVTLLGDTPLQADARSADGLWLRTLFEGQVGWINRDILTPDDALSAQIDTLPVFEDRSPSPMQAFYFRTGIGQPTCSEAPSVVVAQGPERFAVEFTGNGARFVVGSTVALRTLIPDAPVPVDLADGALTAAWLDSPDRLTTAFGDGSVRVGGSALSGGGDAPVMQLVRGVGGALLALGSDGAVRVWLPAENSASPLDLPQPASAVAFAPDGTSFATGHDDVLLLWSLADLAAPADRLALDGVPLALGFSPAGDQLAALTADGLVIFDLATGEMTTQPSGAPADGPAQFFSDGERWLVAYATPDAILLWDVLAGEALASVPAGGVTHFTLGARVGDAPGVQVAFADARGDIQVWEVSGEGGTSSAGLRTVFDGQFANLDGDEVLDIPGPLAHPVFSPDGVVLAFFSEGTAYLQPLVPDRMQLFVVEGETLADGLPVREGFTTVAPLGFDPAIGWETISGPWQPPRPWTPQEYQFLKPIVGIPTNLLHYPIRLPGGQATTFVPPETCVVPAEWTSEYVVQPGDTLAGIVTRLGLNLFEIAEGNCLENPNIIIPGQRLNLPGVIVGQVPPGQPPTAAPPILPGPAPVGPVLEIVSGDNQAALVGTMFAQPLTVRLLDAPGGAPIPNVTVTFTSSGTAPGALFDDDEDSTAEVTTDANGLAVSPPLQALGCPQGSFNVTVTAPPVQTPAAFGLTNTPPNTIVTTDLDNGPGSLRETIAIACPGQTITFANAVFTIAMANGEMFIDKDLIIQGVDPVNQAIDTQGTSRAFNITAGTVTISGLQLTNGDIVGDGGNLLNNANLTLNNMIITGANADNGGNIANTGTMTITASNINGGNGVLNGGNIYNTGTLTVNGGSIIQGGNSGVGGGIFTTGSVTVAASTVTGNFSDAGGGLALLGAGVITVTDSTFTNNTANAGGGGAIAIGAGGGTLNLTRSAILNNVATGTGGVVLAVGATGKIDSSTFQGNTGVPAGGLEEDGAVTTIINSTFSANNGAGISLGVGVVNISFTTINANAGFGLNAPAAGGVVNVKNSLILNHAAECNAVGAINNLGGNFATDGTCGAGFTVGAVPLDALAGGLAQYHPLTAGANPARDSVADCTDTAGAAVAAGQNGAARPTGAACNAGSFED